MSRRKNNARHEMDSRQWSATRTASELVEWRRGFSQMINENPISILSSSPVGYATALGVDGVHRHSPLSMRDAAVERALSTEGLDPEDIVKRPEMLRKAFDLTRLDNVARTVSLSDPYLVSPDMLMLMLAAARSIPEESLNDFVDEVELPAPSGFFWLPTPILMVENPDSSVARTEHWIEWIQWNTVAADHSLEVFGWSRKKRDSVADYFARRGFAIPTHEVEDALRVGFADHEYTEEQREQLGDFLNHHSEIEVSMAEAMSYLVDLENKKQGIRRTENESVSFASTEDISMPAPVGVSVAKLALAFFKLTNQRIVTTSRYADGISVPNPKPKDYDNVRLVRLRRALKESTDSGSSSSSTRIYEHRWVVGVHPRRQWYPSLGRHRTIFIGPYLKGPEGAPLLIGEKVYALIR